MEHKVGDLTLYFKAYSHCYGNGSCCVEVKNGKVVVFEAAGRYTGRPYDMCVKVYKPGDWENVIPVWQPPTHS